MSSLLYSVHLPDTNMYTPGHIYWKAQDDRCWTAHWQQFESTVLSSCRTSSTLNQNRMPQGLCSISTVNTGVISLMRRAMWSQGKAWWWISSFPCCDIILTVFIHAVPHVFYTFHCLPWLVTLCLWASFSSSRKIMRTKTTTVLALNSPVVTWLIPPN